MMMLKKKTKTAKDEVKEEKKMIMEEE